MDGIDKLAAALAKAQAAITCPDRNREVTVKTKTGGSYEFRYSTLDHIIEHVRKPLTDNGLWFSQILEGDEAGKYRLVTRLMHESGQFMESRTPLLVASADNQQFGSALTYMRRYSLAAMLGLAADEDDDGNTADGNTMADKRKPTPKPPAKAPEKPRANKPPAKPFEPPEGYDKVMSEMLTYIAKVTCAMDADSMLNIINTTDKHVGSSMADSKKALNDKVRVLGITYNRKTGKFEDKNADQAEQGAGGHQADEAGTQEAQ